jgi:enoyl-CoA hydratase/carnithine racemase
MLTGMTFDAAKAKQMKLVKDFFDGEVIEHAMKLAQIITSKSLPAL